MSYSAYQSEPSTALKPLKRYLPVLFTLLTISVWSVLALTTNSGQFGDNIEQFNWAHGFAWGYWKHPPLPTILLACVIAVFGNSVYWAYALAALCFMTTSVLTWKIATKLLGKHAAAVTVILLGLHWGFSWRAQIYNHNSVLIMMTAATAWAVLTASESKKLSIWIATGGLAGLALLTKYQAAVPLSGLLFALYRTGALKDETNQKGLIIAFLLACLVFLPHFIWLLNNDFSTLQYAKHSAQNLDTLPRLKKLLGFFLFQVRNHIPMIIDLGLVLGYFHFRKNLPVTLNSNGNSRYVTDWLWGLLGLPCLVLALMVLVGGVKLESHWGLQTFQFACLWLVWRFKSSIEKISIRHFVNVAILIHSVLIVYYFFDHSNKHSLPPLEQNDRMYPAQALADRVDSDWKKSTTCPLKYIVGSGFEAGVVSLYSGSFAAVLESGDFLKSPWINPEDLVKSGSVYIWTSQAPSQTHHLADGVMDMAWMSKQGEVVQSVYWHIELPQTDCRLAGQTLPG